MRQKVSEPTNGSFMILNASRQRRIVGDGGACRLIGVDVDALDVGNVERRRQIVDHGVEQRLHALVLERRAAQHRHERLS
jgi:hypothetical protein